MKMLKNLMVGVFILLPMSALAQYASIDEVLPDRAGLAPVGIFETIEKIVNWTTGLLAIIALLMIVIAGIMYMTAAGDEGRIDTARRILIFAIIGLVVALLGYVIVNVIAITLGAG